MAGEFIWRGPEEARQAIAQMQVEAAAADNLSRERIAKEQTQQQRYVTQSQLADREKDRAVTREDIASRERSRTGTGLDAATRERANIQYRTILDSISAADPLTKQELEAKMAASNLTDDLKDNLRSERERAYRDAKANAKAGDQIAKNYRAELTAKKTNPVELEKVYERIAKDRNVIFDRVSGAVESVNRAPREDVPPAASLMAPGGGVRKIEDVQKKFGSQPAGTYQPALPPAASAISPAQGSGAAVLPPDSAIDAAMDNAYRKLGYVPPSRMPPRVSDLMPAGAGVRLMPATSADYEEYDHRNLPGVGVQRNLDQPTAWEMQRISRGDQPPPFMDISDPVRMAPTVSEIYGPPNNARVQRSSMLAQPRLFGPPDNARIFNSLPRAIRTPGPTDFDELLNIARQPDFRMRSPEVQQIIMDEIGNAAQRMLRVSDMNATRPEYVPMDPYYAPQ